MSLLLFASIAAAFLLVCALALQITRLSGRESRPRMSEKKTTALLVTVSVVLFLAMLWPVVAAVLGQMGVADD